MIDPIGGVAVGLASVDGELVLPEKVRLMCDAHTRQTIAVNDALGGQITVLPRLDDDDVGPWQCDVDADTGMFFLALGRNAFGIWISRAIRFISVPVASLFVIEKPLISRPDGLVTFLVVTAVWF
jgi:hypothetical protein